VDAATLSNDVLGDFRAAALLLYELAIKALESIHDVCASFRQGDTCQVGNHIAQFGNELLCLLFLRRLALRADTLLKALAHAGVVTATRGAAGGYRLARRPAAIRRVVVDLPRVPATWMRTGTARRRARWRKAPSHIVRRQARRVTAAMANSVAWET